MLAALGVLACTLLAARLARDQPYAAALVGWNPLFAIHFAGGGHNDALRSALVLGGARSGRGRPAAAGRRRLGAGRPRQVGPARLLRPARDRSARATGRRVGHVGFAVAAAAIVALATWRYGADWLRAFGPLARNAEEQTSYALPHRLEQLGLPHGLTLALAGARARGGLALARARGVARPRAARAGGLPAARDDALAGALVRVWALPLAAAEDDRRAQLLALGFCAYLLPQAIPL